MVITNNRNNKVNDYINKTCIYIINYCLNNNIGNLVIGYNETLQKDINLGKKNNQNFVYIPVGNIKEKLEYLSEMYGINFVKQEESYTSKASFLTMIQYLNKTPMFQKNMSLVAKELKEDYTKLKMDTI